jgi:hypothetical protein
MHLLALLLVSALALLFAASQYQFGGYEWADRACSGAQALCDSPEMIAVLGASIVLGYLLWALHSPSH